MTSIWMRVRCRLRLVSSLVMGGALIASLGDCAFAQILLDTTLGSENSRVTGISPTIDQINGGATRGANLFHSFQEFNVGEGRSAYFTNPAGIENILTRVTGANPSNILGTLGITGGNANLFLINPNGIIFGPNARLDVGGSFVASTASSIKFADGTEFSAVNPALPLLTISVPIGLQFNGTEGDIVVQGSNQTPAPDNSFTEVGDVGQLPGTAQPVNSATDGTTFNAISGNLDNGNDIDLYQLFLTEEQPFTASTVDGTEVDTQLFLFDGSGLGLSSNDDTANNILQSTVPLNEPFTPAASGIYYLGISSYNNDPLSPQGYIFGASGEPTGTGAGLPLSQWDANNGSGSGAYTITLNPQPDTSLQIQPGKTLALVGGNVTIQGGNLQAPGGRVELGGVAGLGTVGLNVDGNNIDLSFPDDLAKADVSLTNGSRVNVSSNNGGAIQVQGRRITLTEQSAILADTLGSQNGGRIFIQAEQLNIDSGSVVFANTLSSGKGGNVTIETQELIVGNGAKVAAATFGSGDGGDLTVRASDLVKLIGESADGQSVSGLFTEVAPRATGNGGNLTIETGQLIVRDGAQVSAATFGRGAAGGLRVRVPKSVEVVGISADGLKSSGLFTSVEPRARGAGGNLIIETGRLIVRDGAQVSSGTFGRGAAGSLTVRASESVEVIGTSADGQWPSSLYASAEPGATGNGGNLTVETGRLIVRDGADISADTFSGGTAGNLTVRAFESVELIGISLDEQFVSGLFTSTGQGATGAGGNLTVETRRLIVRDGAQVTAGTFGEGAAGNLTVRATGSVEVIGTSADAQSVSILFTSNEQGSTGAGGDLTIETGKLIVRDGGQISSGAFGEGAAGNLTVRASESVEVIGTSADAQSGSLLTAQTRGLGSVGNLTITTRQLLVRDGAEVTVSGESGSAGNLVVEANSILLGNQGKLTAVTVAGDGGNIQLQDLDLLLMRDKSLISAEAIGTANGGNVTIDAELIVAVPSENSDILANADRGKGGNINITTFGIYGLEYRPQLTPKSDINASSQFGVNGTVQINTPGIDPSRGLTNLPTEVVDASNQIAQTCGAGGRAARKNEFIVTGRRGLPSNPYEMLSNDEALSDVHPPSGFNSSRNSKPDTARAVTSKRATSNPKPPIVEAQGWVIDDNGQVVLTATAPTATPHNSGLWSATCPSS